MIFMHNSESVQDAIASGLFKMIHTSGQVEDDLVEHVLEGCSLIGSSVKYFYSEEQEYTTVCERCGNEFTDFEPTDCPSCGSSDLRITKILFDQEIDE